MTFRPFNAETLAELATIQAKIDALQCGCDPEVYCACLSGSCRCMPGQCNCRARSDAIREREAIYQADYDLSRQHRGY